jgi:O-antigen/teichoic acid export membrane protein
VLSLQVVITSLASVQSALFVRNLAFQQLFWVKLVTAFVPGFLSIPLAFFGYGVWALVAGSLAGSLLNLALLWAKSMWRPQLRFDVYLAQELFSFGIWVIMEGLGAWFFTWGDNLLVGKLIGIEELGIYSIAWNINSIIFGLLLNPFLPVLYPTFSRLQNDTQALKEVFRKANTVTISLALPMGTALLLISQQLVSVLFPDKWNGLGFVLSIVCFTNGMAWLVGTNVELYRAMGRPDINTKLMSGTILYYLPAYLLTAPLGLEAFTIVRLGLDLVVIPIHIYLCMRMLGVSPLYLWYEDKFVVLATVVMASVIIGCKQLFILNGNNVPHLMILAILIVVGIATYSGTLWLLDRPFICQMKTLLKRVVLT